MFINADTLQSLQIVETESHPNTHNQGPQSSGSKEGLSVYGIFHHLARSPQGKLRLRQWFLRPTMDINVLQERQRSIAIFVQPDNATQVEDLGRHLRAMRHMRTHIIKLRKGVSPSLPTKLRGSKPVWSTIRQVGIEILSSRSLVDQNIVRFPCSEDSRSHTRGYWRRATTNPQQGKDHILILLSITNASRSWRSLRATT
jgi:DNA mismatch repair protein MSH5